MVSDGVTDEMNAIDMVQYIPLSEPKRVWADALLSAAQKKRHDTYEKIKSSGYDIHTTAPWLQNFYIQKHNEGLKKE